jgi:phage-related minor tail protein
MADLADVTLRISTDYSDVNKAVTATNGLERKVKNLARAYASGKIPQNQFDAGIKSIGRSLQKYSSSYQKAHYDVRTLGQEYLKAEKAQREFMQAQMGATKNNNRMGVATQQLGYQVSDFVVQIQSGTNAFVAFGQQASQLVGVLPLVADRLGLTAMKAIGISSALSVVIPVVTLFGAAWLNTRNVSEKAIDSISDKIQGLGSSLNFVAELDMSAFAESMTTQAKAIQDSFSLILAVMKEVEAKSIQLKFEAFVEPLKESLKAFEYGKVIGKEMTPDTEAGYFEAFGLKDANEAEFVARRLLEIQGKSKEELARSLKLTTEALYFRGLLTNEVKSTLAAIGKEIGLVETVSSAMKIQVDQSVAADRAKKRRLQALYKAQVKDAKEAYAKELEEAVRIYNERKATRKRLDLESYDHQSQLITTQKNEELAEAVRIYQVTKATRERLALESYNHQSQLIQNQKDEEIKVAVEIYNKRKALEEALHNLRVKNEMLMGTSPMFINMDSLSEAARIYRERMREKGKKGPKAPKDALVSLMEDLELQRELLGVEEDRASVLQRLGEDRSKYTQDQIQQAVDATNAIRLQTEELEKQERVADTISQSFGDAFMSIVDGTMSAKDAFRSMAADIIRELYRILVVETMVKSIKRSIFPFADGGVIQGGKQVQAYANGGVVGGPTYFPMAGGKTGLMGEAGPEAIMPLKRGKGGKLGVEVSGDTGAVNIVQNFSFAANGDESVKKIIAEAAPKIANMTQQQIMDARRRGGQMRSTFG